MDNCLWSLREHFFRTVGTVSWPEIDFFSSQYSDIFKEPFLLRVKYSNAYFYIAQNASDPPIVLNVW